MRLAIVLSHPTQYYSPWFRWLAHHTDLHLRVFYLWDFGITPKTDPRFKTTFSWDIDLSSGYDWELVPNRSGNPGTETFFGLFNPGLILRLSRWRPNCVLLFGYAWLSNLTLLAGCSLARLPLVFRGDSHVLGRARIPMLKALLTQIAYSGVSSFACVGKANSQYYTTLGISTKRQVFAPHSVDAGRFVASPELRTRASEMRDSLGITPSTRVVMFSGKFHPDKNPLGLIRAFASLAPRNAALVMAGDGPERETLVSEASRHPGLSIHFLPFANQSEMPARYLLCDLFCLPSTGFHETWGLAVNEAMHMGKPCLVSNLVGCHPDLIDEGRTGWVFDAASPTSLMDSLRSALSADLKPMTTHCLSRIKGYTYAETTRGLLQAISVATHFDSACEPGSGVGL
jgi:glycosyltransferase involved in cell wall biosynthesis